MHNSTLVENVYHTILVTKLNTPRKMIKNRGHKKQQLQITLSELLRHLLVILPIILLALLCASCCLPPALLLCLLPPSASYNLTGHCPRAKPWSKFLLLYDLHICDTSYSIALSCL